MSLQMEHAGFKINRCEPELESLLVRLVTSEDVKNLLNYIYSDNKESFIFCTESESDDFDNLEDPYKQIKQELVELYINV